MFVTDNRRFGASDGPTVGVSISPWVIVLVAAVWLAPRMLGTYLAAKKKES